MLYLFAGAPRRADINSFLHAISLAQDFDLNVREVDIERSESDDLSSAQLWEQLLAEIRDGKYDVIIMSPPCGTWSRVRFQWQLHPGPRPQRNKSWPWGFSWLSAAQRKKVDVANYFVSQTIQAAYIASAAGTFFLIEHPEDLGSVNGEYPASIWQLEDMRDLQIATEATTWAIFQCAFGADTSIPPGFFLQYRASSRAMRSGRHLIKMADIWGHCQLGALTSVMSGV